MLLAAALGMATLAATPAIAQPGADVYNCEDFGSQEEAQLVYNFDFSDPNGLDADGDGVACEEFPYEGLEPLPEGSPPLPPGETLQPESPVSCNGFASQFGAQQFFDSNATAEEQAILDPDGNGFACDDGTIELGVGPADAPIGETVDVPAPAAPAASEAMTALPDTSGPALLLPASGLLIGAGLIGLRVIRKS